MEIEGWHIALLIKPFALVVLFGGTFLVARFMRKNLPDGRLKRFLLFSWKV